MKFHPSSLQRIALCPGSLNAAEGYRGTETEESKSGQRVHKALATMVNLEHLKAGKVGKILTAEMLSMLKSDREVIVATWFAGIVQKVVNDSGGVIEVVREKKLALKLSPDVEIEGTPDLMLKTADNTIRVFEYKTGQGEQATSDINLQEQAYIAMVWGCLKPGTKPVDVVGHLLAAGNEAGERHTFSKYKPKLIYGLTEKIKSICLAAMQPGAKRVPSFDACRYCPAKATKDCPETLDAVMKFADKAGEVEQAQAIFNQLEPDRRGKAIEKCKLVVAVAEAILDAAKVMLEQDPASIPGWCLSEGRKRREIKDAGICFKILADKIGLAPTAFVEAVNVSISKLEKVVHTWQACKAERAGEKPPTKKAVKELLDSILVEVIESKIGSGSLKKSG